MINVLIGIVTGLLIASLLLSIELWLKSDKGIVKRVIKPLENVLKPKGSIVLPPDELEKARQEIINKNNAEGKDTKLSELYD